MVEILLRHSGPILSYGINFYLYIISGQKFRSDVVNLFKCRKKHRMNTTVSVVSVSGQVIG